MAELLTYLQQHRGSDWLLGDRSEDFSHLVDSAMHQLRQKFPAQSVPRILLVEPHPVKFLAYFTAAGMRQSHLFLANPNWGNGEWQQAITQVQPNLLWGDAVPATLQSAVTAIAVNSHLPGSLIMLPTGGSSGQVRFVMHTWETLMASVQGFRQYFNLNQVDSFCGLPLYHISGLMQFLRSFTSGGRLVIAPFKAVEAGDYCYLDPADFFISLVPTQLQRLLHHPTQAKWLAQFQTVLLGGAPAWPELLQQARALRIPLAPTYGMTETASQIATLKPDEFLAGGSGSGQVLPHASIQIHPAAHQHHEEGGNVAGMITIQSAALALGYYPRLFEEAVFQPDDLGFFDPQGSLQIAGRRSDKIITGGENVFPVEVEAAIRATGLVQDVCVVGIADRLWGQAIAAVYQPCHTEVAASAIAAALANTLSRYKHPKHWIAIEQFPRNAQGKVNRLQIQTLVKQWWDRAIALASEA